MGSRGARAAGSGASFGVIAALLAALAAGGALAADCPFAPWANYQGTEIRATSDRHAYLYVTGRKAVDADGAPRAYHPDDVGRSCGPRGAGLDCPANAGYPRSSWWSDVLAPDPQDRRRAFVQPSGPDAGFFVSKTALADGARNERDPARYVDAARVPYLVFPGPFYRMRGTGRLGDIGIARQLEGGRQTPFIVADIGPAEPLGEASIALFAALGGTAPNPRTGEGVPPGKTLYLLFPQSVQQRTRPWPLDQAAMAEEAEALLAAIGGQAALDACAAELR